jgi:hypothetical protein
MIMDICELFHGGVEKIPLFLYAKIPFRLTM